MTKLWVRRPRVDYVLATNDSHGSYRKSFIVLHQTISPDRVGTSDGEGVGHYLDNKGYGIHAIVDVEGYSGAVPRAHETDIYSHVSSGGLNMNSKGIGIEQVSYKTGDPQYWWRRAKQLHKTARWCAYYCKTHGIRPYYDPTCKLGGIVGHADVTRAGGVSGGHTDCQYPNYPTKQVALLTRNYLRLGWA